MSFNYSGDYTCECGKHFTNSQQFNGHKTHCKTHLEAVGKLDARITAQQKFIKSGATFCIEKHQNSVMQKQFELERWIQEQHRCEKCGKVMTEFYGTGRFCSQSCSNRRVQRGDTKTKIGNSLKSRSQDKRGDYAINPIICKHCNYSLTYEERARATCPACCLSLYEEKKQPKQTRPRIAKKKPVERKPVQKKLKYVGPELPVVEDQHRSAGFFPRNKMSYAELFWKQVLDNNHVSYKHDYKVKNRAGTAVYRLDFLIDDHIDFEVDGSEHEEYLYKDIVRYIWLEELGYESFRVKWVNPNNDKNKMIVNCQIQQLLDFIGYPRIC